MKMLKLSLSVGAEADITELESYEERQVSRRYGTD
jgi:hypothetical protein